MSKDPASLEKIYAMLQEVQADIRAMRQEYAEIISLLREFERARNEPARRIH